MSRVEEVSAQQAALLVAALGEQRRAIVSALDGLAHKLGFRESAIDLAGELARPDVLALRRRRERSELFVGIARGFTEPAHDREQHELVRTWVRHFASLTNKRRGGEAPAIANGYLMVGAYDDASASSWASLLTAMARPHRIQRDGAPARFVVNPLDTFWMAC
jgi:hypothetical protein